MTAAFGGEAVVVRPLQRITRFSAGLFLLSGEKLTLQSVVDFVWN